MKYFVLGLALTMAVHFVYAQDDVYEEIDHATRQIAVGIAGAGDDNSLSATVIVPIRGNKISDTSWAGGFVQQQTSDGEVTAEVLNAHTVVGYDVHDIVSLNAFADWNRDKQRGIAGQTQFGGFVGVDIYEENGWKVTGGAGNFLESKQALEDLEKKANDSAVVRALGYVKVGFGRYSVRLDFTPKLDLSHPQTSVKGKAAFSLNDKLSLVVSGVAGYDSEPLVDGEEFYTSHQAQFNLTF